LAFAKIGGVSPSSNGDPDGVTRKIITMKTLAKISLTASVILFAVSLTGPGSEFLWGFLKPLSALLFVNFFIMNLLAKEYAKYDEEHEFRLALAKQITQRPAEPKREVVRHSPAPQPTFAH
jgi:hypothetical protein